MSCPTCKTAPPSGKEVAVVFVFIYLLGVGVTSGLSWLHRWMQDQDRDLHHPIAVGALTLESAAELLATVARDAARCALMKYPTTNQLQTRVLLIGRLCQLAGYENEAEKAGLEPQCSPFIAHPKHRND